MTPADVCAGRGKMNEHSWLCSAQWRQSHLFITGDNPEHSYHSSVLLISMGVEEHACMTPAKARRNLSVIPTQSQCVNISMDKESKSFCLRSFLFCNFIGDIFGVLYKISSQSSHFVFGLLGVWPSARPPAFPSSSALPFPLSSTMHGMLHGCML